jgi:hypothetical protein
MILENMRYRNQEVHTTFDKYYTSITGRGTCDGFTYENRMTSNPSPKTRNSWSTEMWDVVTPNFKVRSARGEIINSPMKKISITEDRGKGLLILDHSFESYGCSPSRWYKYYDYTSTGEYAIADIFPYLDINSTAVISDLTDLAVTQAWANIDSSKVMELVCLAEFDKTIDGLKMLLKSVCKVIAYAYTAHKHALKSRRYGKELFTELKDIYMQARYGLRPLYYDVKGILAAYNTDKTNQKTRQTYRVYQDYTDTDSDSFESLWGTKYVQTYYKNANRSSSIHTTVRAGVLTQLDILTNNKLAGIDLIAESAWELVPFSFIVDWFFNVGSLISSWAPNVGAQTLASWVTVDELKTQTITGCSSRVVNNNTSSMRATSGSMGYYGTAQKVTHTVTREPEPRRPTLPVLDVNLDPLKLLDLGIIAAQIRKRIPFLKQFRY